MTQIKDSTELDFCDVLFMPKRTTLNSRSEADVIREYKFKYYPHTLKTCGIMAANMATRGVVSIESLQESYNTLMRGTEEAKQIIATNMQKMKDYQKKK